MKETVLDNFFIIGPSKEIIEGRKRRAQQLFNLIPDDKSDQALLRMCGCGGSHAFMLIQNKDVRGYLGPLLSKEDCRLTMVGVQQEYALTEAMIQGLQEQIESIPLPEIKRR